MVYLDCLHALTDTLAWARAALEVVRMGGFIAGEGEHGPRKTSNEHVVRF